MAVNAAGKAAGLASVDSLIVLGLQLSRVGKSFSYLSLITSPITTATIAYFVQKVIPYIGIGVDQVTGRLLG